MKRYSRCRPTIQFQVKARFVYIDPIPYLAEFLQQFLLFRGKLIVGLRCRLLDTKAFLLFLIFLAHFNLNFA